jgi:hypothetical protein
MSYELVMRHMVANSETYQDINEYNSGFVSESNFIPPLSLTNSTNPSMWVLKVCGVTNKSYILSALDKIRVASIIWGNSHHILQARRLL